MTACLHDTTTISVQVSPLITHVRVPCTPAPADKFIRRPTRGRISGFSARARRRLTTYLLSLEQSPDVLVTLTYPSEWPSDPKVWKRHLDNFCKRVRYNYPDSWFIWKLEFQKRGAPHYHLLGSFGSGVKIDQKLKSWVSRVWYEIVGSGDEKHLRAGTNIQSLTTNTKIISYVSKYVSKEDQLQDDNGNPVHVGRWWGRVGKLPHILRIEFDLDLREFYQLRRLVKRWLKSQARKKLEAWKNIPIFRRHYPFKGFRFLAWYRRFEDCSIFLHIDMVNAVRMIRAVCQSRAFFTQTRPIGPKFSIQGV